MSMLSSVYLDLDLVAGINILLPAYTAFIRHSVLSSSSFCLTLYSNRLLSGLLSLSLYLMVMAPCLAFPGKLAPEEEREMSSELKQWQLQNISGF